MRRTGERHATNDLRPCEVGRHELDFTMLYQVDSGSMKWRQQQPRGLHSFAQAAKAAPRD
ncbi:hypothetical protein BwSH12_65560 [Bradyrhizobium ottawaense]|nr:hypothetical protein BwSG20_74130 [Bradyrhizobium ottawaense]GMP20550.1 hypothetical protein BwSH12_65560 [Bradyrhizobium ottawaense]